MMEAVDFPVDASHAIIAPIMAARLCEGILNNSDNPIALHVPRVATGGYSTC